jgi:hypothetical protein
MKRDRPDEIKPQPLKEEEDREPRSIANMAALGAILTLVILGYWVFVSLSHSRSFQRCLDSGRRNCVDFLTTSK